MSVIIRLQNLPWSANALDIRNFFRGLSIPEGGVHIVGGELGDAFIAFSTDEDARQGMMLNGGKIKEIQVKLLLSSRSEMHKVIEAARQSVPILTLTAPAPPPAPTPTPIAPVVPAAPTPPAITPFSAALGTSALSGFGIPGIGNPQEIPQPAVIELPPPLNSPTQNTSNNEDEKDDEGKSDRRKERDRRRTRSRSRSRDRDRKDRKRDRRSRSRDRRRGRDRSRSRERRDRKRDRKDRSRSRERSPRRFRDKRDRKSPPISASQDRSLDGMSDSQSSMGAKFPNKVMPIPGQGQPMMVPGMMPNGPMGAMAPMQAENRFNDPAMADTFNKLQELGKKRNPNAFQGDQQNGNRFGNRGGGNAARGGANFRRDNRQTRFEDPHADCCVAIRNAPNHTSYGDVRRFFPFMIDKHGIKMINDNMGRRTGTIYVRFCDTRSKQLALQKKVNELKGAQVIVEPLDDEIYEAAVDSFLPFREDNDDDDASLVIIADNDDPPAAQPPVNIIKLSDLPYYVKEHDIMKTFSDFSLLSITLKDCRLTRSKVAYVHFVKSEDAKLVLDRKDTYQFGRRHPTIVAATVEEYEKEKANSEEESSPPNGTEQPAQEPPPRDPRQRRQQEGGAPPPAAAQAQGPPVFFPSPQFPVPVQNFPAAFPAAQFPPFPARPGLPQMQPRAAGGGWGVRPPFPNQPDQMPAANARVISVEMENDTLDCILMTGLPRDANDRSIVTFLSDTGAVPARIHIMLDGSGAPSGECYCEFRSVQEAMQAATKHGHVLDDCRLTVNVVSKRVVEEALEGPKADSKREGLLGNGPNPPFFEAQRGGFFPPFRGRGGFRGGFDQGRGGFENRGDFHGRGAFRGRGNWNERGGRGFDRGRGRGFGRGRGGMFENGRERDREEDTDPALEDFGAPGCVVSMENVPFRATIDDILSFFAEFDLSQDDVIRRYNERGNPTGDARAAFHTQFDAQRAVQMCHLKTIHDRRIHLSLL